MLLNSLQTVTKRENKKQLTVLTLLNQFHQELVLTLKHLMVNLQIHKNKVIPVAEKQIQNNQNKNNLTQGRKHQILII